MNINFDKNSIALFGKAYKLDVLLRKYAILSGNQIYNFLSNRRIQIPRALNVMAITAVLNKKILLLQTDDLDIQEFNRLQYYHYFTEEQLFRLVKRLGISNEEFEEYRMNIFKLIVENAEALDLSDGEFSYLKNLKKLPIESFEKYFNYVSSASLESSNTFDGVDLDILEKYLPLTATDDDLQDICEKYGIEIPYTLEKSDYLDYVSNYLNQTNKASRTVMNELSRMTIEQLETYCDRMDIPMHINMSTSERARYLLYYLSLCSISKTVVDNLVADDSYYPIEFNIDFNKINKGIVGPCIIYNDNEDVMETIESENDVEEEAIAESNEEENNDTIIEENDNSFDPVLDDSLVEEVIIEDENDDSNQDEVALDSDDTSLEASNSIEDNTDNQELDNDEASNEVALEESDTTDDISFEDIPNPFENNSDNTINEELDNDSSDSIENPIDNSSDSEANINDDIIDNKASNDEFNPSEELEGVNIDDDTQALIDSILDTNQDEEKPEVVLDEALKDVRGNESFGDKKLLKLTQGNGALITAISVGVIVLLIVGFAVWARFFR